MAKYAPPREDGLKPYRVEVSEWGRKRERIVLRGYRERGRVPRQGSIALHHGQSTTGNTRGYVTPRRGGTGDERAVTEPRTVLGTLR